MRFRLAESVQGTDFEKIFRFEDPVTAENPKSPDSKPAADEKVVFEPVRISVYRVAFPPLPFLPAFILPGLLASHFHRLAFLTGAG